MATKRASEFARMIESGGVGGEALSLLKDDVAHIATVGQDLPAAEVLGGLVELQESIFSVIERGGHRVRDARDLFVGAAMTTAMLSKVMQDLGRSHQALSLCRTVYVCADAADHVSLQAWARNQMSLICYRTGSARRALDFADAAVAITQDSRGSAKAWAWSLKARAAALIQSDTETRDAITQARVARETTTPDDLDDIGGLFEFSTIRQTYYAAGALASLPNAGREAESEALEAISFFENTAGSYATEAGARSELALARVKYGEVEGASEALRLVLALPPERRIVGILDSVHRVHQALNSPDVRSARSAVDLRDEIESYRTLTAARAIGSD
jgi:tetratricopeptide (TPR) repeat protein